MKKTRLIVLLLFIVMSVCAIGFCFLSAANTTTPILYRNDTKYSTTEYPVEVLEKTVYVPVSFFVGLNNIEYKFDKNNNSFYFRNKATGRFLSFSFDVEGIVVDNTFTSVVFPLMNSTVYMPLEYCADILSLKIEKDSTERIRLCDGSEKLTFKELIELYDPSVKPDDPSVINPENPEAPTEIDVDRYLYITVNIDLDSDANKILDVLQDWGKKATLFFSAQAIEKNPSAVIRAFAQNHSIGILSDTDTIEETNRVLYEVVGFCSRLLRLPKDITLDDAQRESLTQKGYIIWGYTKECTATDSNSWTVARDIYNSTFLNDITVLKLDCEEHCIKTLTYILSLISDDIYIEATTITPTTPEIKEAKNGK